MADVQVVRKAEQVEVTVTSSPESAPAERVRIAGLEAILGNDVLAKLTAAADADGMLPLAEYTQIVRTPVHSRSIPIGHIESKFFGHGAQPKLIACLREGVRGPLLAAWARF